MTMESISPSKEEEETVVIEETKKQPKLKQGP